MPLLDFAANAADRAFAFASETADAGVSDEIADQILAVQGRTFFINNMCLILVKEIVHG